MGSQQMRILIVEDSLDDRNMFAHYLSTKGCVVSKAGDGQEAIEKAFEIQPHLIILDLWLPKISGWGVMERLRADDRTRDIPILVVTGHSLVPPLNCDGFLVKPVPLIQLRTEITRILGSSGEGTAFSPRPSRA